MIHYSKFSLVVGEEGVDTAKCFVLLGQQTIGAPRRDLQDDLGEWLLSLRPTICSPQKINTVKTEMVINMNVIGVVTGGGGERGGTSEATDIIDVQTVILDFAKQKVQKNIDLKIM
ncbi:hypothetical protein E2C01_079403 [Portunus trituberculatus]|uniref:Uncharacterized protein n=1 Tax=Portunus trituberculatus TaxID=210409 RepID=A0A5B7IVJ2_PORTR|nr:hypothetical protein [Portunus trituberculatus]